MLVAADGEAFGRFPTLDGADAAIEEDGDFFPGVESIVGGVSHG